MINIITYKLKEEFKMNKKKALRIVERIASYRLRKEEKSGGPVCMGIYYQPKRPEVKNSLK